MHRLEIFLKCLSNPLEWRSSSKALLVFSIILSLHLYYALIARCVLGLDDPPQLLSIPHVARILDAALVCIGLSASLFLVTSVLGRIYRDTVLFEYIAASYFCLSLCYFSYQTGTLSLATGAALAGAPVLGFILFHRGAVLVALVIGIVTLTLLSYASALGYLPYAPVLRQPMVVDGVLSAFWLTLMLAFTAPHLIILTVLAYLVLRRWRQREREVRLLSMTDSLTGLYNRRSILSHLNRELDRSSHQGPSLAVLMVDLDHFKQINDTWGHPAGDQALITAAQALRDSVRQNDMIGRYGGEEFLIILPGTDTAGALLLAERCRDRLTEAVVDLGSTQSLRISASIGLCCNEDDRTLSAEDLLRYADDALYAAKSGGRNRVVTATAHRPATLPG